MILEALELAAKVLFVVVFFSLCIFVHELGHLLVALWRGLHVERFSIGFGKKLWGTRYKGVEYIISALPFGGYVALPQLDPTDEPTTAAGDPLPQASPTNRALTALAGPAANIVFGFFLALFIWRFGVLQPAPMPYCEVFSVPSVLPLYKNGLKPDDRIVAVDGVPVSEPSANLAEHIRADAPEVVLRVQRGDVEEEFDYTPTPNPEYLAGLRAGDRIFAVNGEPIRRGWEDMTTRIVLSPGEVTLLVQRNMGDMFTMRYRPAPNPMTEGLGYPFFKVLTPIVVRRVVDGSPAQHAGVLPDDRILRLNGKTVLETDEFIRLVRESGGAPMQLVVERESREVQIEGLRAEEKLHRGEEVLQIGIHFGLFTLSYPTPWQQFTTVYNQTKDTLRALFAKGSQVKPRHMSGPVGILQMIWYKVRFGGFREGLSFIILVTFNLAFFNLLPIPVLDGGHIVYSGIEIVSRRRIPTRLAYGVQTAFAVLLITFMLYVTFFDVQRIPRFWRLLRPRDTEEVQERAAEPPDAERIAVPETDEKPPPRAVPLEP